MKCGCASTSPQSCTNVSHGQASWYVQAVTLLNSLLCRVGGAAAMLQISTAACMLDHFFRDSSDQQPFRVMHISALPMRRAKLQLTGWLAVDNRNLMWNPQADIFRCYHTAVDRAATPYFEIRCCRPPLQDTKTMHTSTAVDGVNLKYTPPLDQPGCRTTHILPQRFVAIPPTTSDMLIESWTRLHAQVEVEERKRLTATAGPYLRAAEKRRNSFNTRSRHVVVQLFFRDMLEMLGGVKRILFRSRGGFHRPLAKRSLENAYWGRRFHSRPRFEKRSTGNIAICSSLSLCLPLPLSPHSKRFVLRVSAG